MTLRASPRREAEHCRRRPSGAAAVLAAFRGARQFMLGSLLVAACAGGCRRSPPADQRPDAGAAGEQTGRLVCVEQPDGCVFCAGKDEHGSFLEPDQSRPLVCDPADEESCVEFCSLATPACALPWSKTKGCLYESDIEFRRALFNLQAADRPELTLSGRVLDEAGRRITGASVRVWLAWPALPGLVPLFEEVSGRDGGFKTILRAGPWAYSIRVSHPEHATLIVDRLPADRPDRFGGNSPRLFRLGPQQTIRGRVLDLATGLPVAGASVHATRAQGDPTEVAAAESGEDGGFVIGGLEARRYTLNVSKFGWRPLPVNPPVTPGQRVTLKLIQANVIRGSVIAADGESEPGATVAAVLASAPSVPSPPIFWTSDNDGRFAQDHFPAGTYYLWARRGDMLAYPPSRIELQDSNVVEVRVALSHKGARVSGQVQLEHGRGAGGELSVELVSRSPLSFPRNPRAKVDEGGRFVLAGVLPGRYRFGIKRGIRPMAILSGPREVEIPIEPGSAVALDAPIVVRPRVED
jgi:hypothetical protein